jgi:hypothetical protein
LVKFSRRFSCFLLKRLGKALQADRKNLPKHAIEEEQRELKETGSSSVSGRTRVAACNDYRPFWASYPYRFSSRRRFRFILFVERR